MSVEGAKPNEPCFICGDTDNNVLYCGMCKHYFCGGCRTKYGTRLLAAANEKMATMKNIVRKLVW